MDRESERAVLMMRRRIPYLLKFFDALCIDSESARYYMSKRDLLKPKRDLLTHKRDLLTSSSSTRFASTGRARGTDGAGVELTLAHSPVAAPRGVPAAHLEEHSLRLLLPAAPRRAGPGIAPVRVFVFVCVCVCACVCLYDVDTHTHTLYIHTHLIRSAGRLVLLPLRSARALRHRCLCLPGVSSLIGGVELGLGRSQRGREHVHIRVALHRMFLQRTQLRPQMLRNEPAHMSKEPFKVRTHVKRDLRIEPAHMSKETFNKNRLVKKREGPGRC